jgi:chromosome segregation ATPase
VQSKDEVDSMREERSQLVAQLQTALEQIQVVTEREALLASELKGLQENKDHAKAMFASEIWNFPPQQDSGEKGTFLATSVNQPPSQLKKVTVLREEVGLTSEVDKLVATECKEHAEGLGDEKKQLETLSVMDGLRQHVQRQEEKKTQHATSLCESCQSLQEDSVAEASLADVTDMREEEIVQQDLQRLDIKIGNTEESQEEEEKEEKDEEVPDSFSKVMNLQQQLKELQEENANLASRLQAAEQLLKVHSDENEQLRNQLETILQEQKMREVEISSELRTWKEHADSLEVEKLRNLSVIEESYQHLQRLEEENKELATSSGECAQSLQAALQEITQLANEVDKLEHEKDLQIGKTWVQAAELQKAQEQLQAASERDICHGSELKELDVERVELQSKVQELQLQLHGLNDENVHVVAELRELGQKLETLAAEKKLLATNVDQLVEERQKREAEIAEELATWKEHVQNLEAEKMEFLSSAEDLNQQIWRLGEDKKKLIHESNQSLQELWGENARLKKEIGKLEAEKDRHDGERLELVAGLQTVWEKLQAANERETFLTKEVTGLQGWRDAELTGYVAKVRELEQQLQELGEKSDVAVAKSLETSHKLDELQMDNVKLKNEVSELVQERGRREEEMAREQATWKEKFEAERSNLQLENENLKSVSEDLHKQLERSGEEIKQWGMKSAEFSLMLEELQEEKTRLVGELDKLEEVKERQEGERLELAADLQKAWNHLQEVGTSESNLTSELQVLREDTEKERVKFAGEVQDLQQQLQKLREDNHQLLIRVQGLMQTLEELHDAKVNYYGS